MSREKSLEAADVRFYCDNDPAGPDPAGMEQRWEPVPDLSNAPSKERNSNLPFKKKLYWDERNKIYHGRNDKGCQDPSSRGGATYAQTYNIRDNSARASGQNPRRQTVMVSGSDIIICISPFQNVLYLRRSPRHLSAVARQYRTRPRLDTSKHQKSRLFTQPYHIPRSWYH